MKKSSLRKRALALGLLASLILSTPAPAVAANASGYPLMERIYGQDRYETSIQVAQKLYPKGTLTMILASGKDYPDALSGVPLARQKNAPLLLVGPSPESSQQVLDYIKQNLLPNGKIYLLGGAGAISEDFIPALQQMGITDIVRLGGQDRYETALAIAKEISHDGQTFYLVSGDNFPDALSASVLAATAGSVPAAKSAYYKGQGQELTPALGGVPILLLPAGEPVPDSLISYLNSVPAKGAQTFHVLGGSGAVPESSIQQLQNSLERYGSLTRAAGQDRYETNYLANAGAFDLSWENNGEGLPVPKVYLTTGENFADALAGAVIAAQNQAPLVLLNDRLPEASLKLLQEYYELNKKRIPRTETYIFGGPGVLSADTVMRADYAFNYGQTEPGRGNVQNAAEKATELLFPADAAKAPDGTLYISDSKNHVLKALSPTGQIREIGAFTLAKDKFGWPIGGDSDGPADTARFNEPKGLAFDRAGNLYIVDSGNGTLRRLSPAGQVSTLARDMKKPTDIVFGQTGEYYLTDTLNHRILKGTPEGGYQVLAGGGYLEKDGWLRGGYKDGAGREAQFNEPSGLALGSDGTLYVADTGNQRIRAVSPEGTVTTLAGSGAELIPNAPYISGGYRDGAAGQARFNFPSGLALTPDGSLLIADTYGHRIRKLTPDGQVSTVTGTGDTGKENGYLMQARLNGPVSILPDGPNEFLMVDQFNQLLRRLVIE